MTILTRIYDNNDIKHYWYKAAKLGTLMMIVWQEMDSTNEFEVRFPTRKRHRNITDWSLNTAFVGAM